MHQSPDADLWQVYVVANTCGLTLVCAKQYAVQVVRKRVAYLTVYTKYDR
jgi:hypothetical protein